MNDLEKVDVNTIVLKVYEKIALKYLKRHGSVGHYDLMEACYARQHPQRVFNNLQELGLIEEFELHGEELVKLTDIGYEYLEKQ